MLSFFESNRTLLKALVKVPLLWLDRYTKLKWAVDKMRASKSKLQFGNFLFFFWHCSKGINNTSPCSSNLGGDHLTFNLVGGWFLNNLQAYLYKNQIHAHELCWIKEFKHVHGTEKKSPTPRKKIIMHTTRPEKKNS